MACLVLCLRCQSEEGFSFALFFTQSAYDQMALWESFLLGGAVAPCLLPSKANKA